MAEQRQGRESQNRAVNERAKSWTPPQTLPNISPRDGWTHRWIRTSIMGHLDNANTLQLFTTKKR
jgi:hypothetical protein